MSLSASGHAQVTLVLRDALLHGRTGIAREPATTAPELAAVAAFAHFHGLTVVAKPHMPDHVALAGPPDRLSRAFGVNLSVLDHPTGKYHRHVEPLRAPPALSGIVHGVLGLDETPASISRLHYARKTADRSRSTRATIAPVRLSARPPRIAAATGEAGTPPAPPPLSPLDLASRYNFPRDLTGSGQRIAVIALGGGYHRADVDAYFADLGLSSPTIRDVSVEGARNSPLAMDPLRTVIEAYNRPGMALGQLWRDFPHELADAIMTVEATMDVQLAGAVAPGAAIDVYFAPNSPQGLYHAILAALGNEPDEQRGPPAAISLSWGWPEEQMTGESAELINAALERAWSLGSCVCCASGDSGSLGIVDDNFADDPASVLFPASSPWVLACGGTELDASGAESTWNDVSRGVQQATGGGVSGAFALPVWQRDAGVPPRRALNGAAWVAPSLPPLERQSFVGRGVPDVAAYAAQEPGYRLIVGGTVCGAGGTSAATPLWAGLVARLAERVGSEVRSIPRVAYSPRFSAAFRAIEQGTNAMHGATSAAAFEASAGWNACCGLGTPDGTRLLHLLQEQVAAPPA